MATGITPSSVKTDDTSNPLAPPVNGVATTASKVESSSHSQQAAAPLVEVRHLRKSFGDQLAVNDVSFSLRPGEILGLLGPNGAGKSTTMMVVAGLLAPTSGEVLLNGTRFDGRDREFRRLLGVVPQEYAIYQELSAVDNLCFFGKLYGLSGQTLKDRCDEVLERVGLTESAHRASSTFSGGMKRRLNFGVALMHRPSILILDEPTVGVDPHSRSHLMECVRQLASEGVGIIYASHYMEEVQAICQTVAIIDHGSVLAYDSIQSLLAGIAADLYLYVDHTSGIGDQLGDLARIGTGSDGEPAVIVAGDAANDPPVEGSDPLRMGAGTLSPDPSNPSPGMAWRLQATLYKLSNLGVRVLRIETQQSNLERLFLRLTGKHLRD